MQYVPVTFAQGLPQVVPMICCPDPTMQQTVVPEGSCLDDQPEMGFASDIRQTTLTNEYFRRVLYTSPTGTTQVIVGSLGPSQDAGIEVYGECDTTVRVEYGSGHARIGNDMFVVGPGSLFVVPAGVVGNLVNGPSDVLKYNAVFAGQAPLPPGQVTPYKIPPH